MPLAIEEKDHLLLITLNRPEALNSMDVATYRALGNLWWEFRKREDLYVAIITGAGDKAFCTGSDLKDVSPKLNDGTLDPSFINEAMLEGIPLYKPVIAAVNGYAVGGGMELMLACDLAIASDNAQFGLSEIRWARLPGFGLASLPRVVPKKVAMELILTGDRISAQEAYRLGLVNRVTTQAELMPMAMEMARKIASLSPFAVRVAKETTLRGLQLSQTEARALTHQMMKSEIFPSLDAKEGLRAFAEKRPPKWQGK